MKRYVSAVGWDKRGVSWHAVNTSMYASHAPSMAREILETPLLMVGSTALGQVAVKLQAARVRKLPERAFQGFLRGLSFFCINPFQMPTGNLRCCPSKSQC